MDLCEQYFAVSLGPVTSLAPVLSSYDQLQVVKIVWNLLNNFSESES